MISITALSQYLLEDFHDYQYNPESHCAHYDRIYPEVPSLSCDGSSGGETVTTRRVGGPGACCGPDGRGSFSDLSASPVVQSTVGYDQLQLLDADSCSRHSAAGDESVRSGRISASGPAWYPGAHPTIVACNSLLRSLPKKFRDLTSLEAESAAATKFMAINNGCRDWVLAREELFSWEEELVGLVKTELDNFLHPGGELLVPDITAIFDRGRCGPGASLGANGVDFYTKLFSSHLTATSFDVYYQYAAWCATDPNWRSAEFHRLTTFGLPTITLDSSMTFVQKNRDMMRSICTEPSLNMFAQLGLGALLEDRLRSSFGIDLGGQPARNVGLARLGSINGSVCTIDLESASDSFSIGLAEELLPRWFYDLLMQYRTPYTRVKSDRVLLWMVSTMGNGFTFPLQTLLFSCCVRAVARQFSCPLGRADADNSQWGVFGDDIICPSFMADRLCRLLALLGFRVNGEKSYIDKYGTFRESCGSDWYKGWNVRGLYLKSLRTPQSRYVAINLLNEWSARWGIPLTRAIGYLRDSVRILAIPGWAPVDSGIRVPSEAMTLGFVLLPRSKRWMYSYIFRHYEAWVPSLMVLEDHIAIPANLNRVRRRNYNPSGLLLSVVGGYISGGKIPLSLKQGESPRYRMRTSVSPFWGPDVQQVILQSPVFWERWKTAALQNLF